MIVTTALRETQESVDKARRLAEEAGVRYVSRGNRSIRKTGEAAGDRCVLVVLTDLTLQFFHEDEPAMFFHPSTSFIRVARMRKHGGPDFLLRAAEVAPGDRILDCTAGLGSDAIVLAYGAGEEGRVTALESETPLYLLLRDGLAQYEADLTGLTETMRRIRVEHADHAGYLRSMPDDSVDVVYFDPMFRRPLRDVQAIDRLRPIANPAALSPEVVAEACRVARRTVIMKELRGSGEFARLGFEEREQKQSQIAYGVIKL